jgi:hypothetical protein
MASILVPRLLRAPASDQTVLVSFPYPRVGLIGDAEAQQVGMPQIGELFDRLDGAEPIQAALVVVNEIPIRAEDGKQLELVIDLSAMAGPAIVIGSDDGGVIGRMVGIRVCRGKIGF